MLFYKVSFHLNMVQCLTFLCDYCYNRRFFSTCIMVPISSSPHCVCVSPAAVLVWVRIRMKIIAISGFYGCKILRMLFAMSDKRSDICNLRICEFCSYVWGLVVESDYLFEWYYMQIWTCVLRLLSN